LHAAHFEVGQKGGKEKKGKNRVKIGGDTVALAQLKSIAEE